MMPLRDKTASAALGLRMLPTIRRGKGCARNAGHRRLAAKPLDDGFCWLHVASVFPIFRNQCQ